MPERRKRIHTSHVGNVLDAQLLDPRIMDEPVVQAVAADLRACIEEDHERNMMIDFGAVERITSSAIGKFIMIRRLILAAQGKLVLYSMRPEIFEVFKRIALEGMFSIRENQQAALEYFTLPPAAL